jgi:hypothetical protein
MLLTSIAILSIGVRLLSTYNHGTTALLYVGIPFLVSLVLIKIRDPSEPATWQKQYKNRLIDAFIIMFGSSVILFEGFVCVVMFMPIYLFIILLMFISRSLYDRQRKKSKGSLSIHILPVLIVLSAFEGVSPQLSYNRNETVSVSRVVHRNIHDIKNNLLQPMNLKKSRPWFLALFPMPDKIKAGSLTSGDVHEIHFKYYRWFFTNLHQGRMLLEINDISEDKIKTTFIDDTSYIANYLELKGTEIKLEEIDNNVTRITLTIKYNRKLDPYWYFSPIERYGISKTANFLITEVIARERR